MNHIHGLRLVPRTTLALLLLFAIGVMAAPALADHGNAAGFGRRASNWRFNRPNHVQTCGYSVAGHGAACGHGISVSAQHRAFDRGYELGLRDGRTAGYRDARWNRGWNPHSSRCLNGHRPAFREGYLTGFESGYARAFKSARKSRHWYSQRHWRHG